LLAISPLCAADTVRVLQMRTQKVGEVSYFHVTLEVPPDLRFPVFPWDFNSRAGQFTSDGDALPRRLGQLPSLVPQDGSALLYARWPAGSPPRAGDTTLEFAGKVRGAKPVVCLLVYPSRDVPSARTSGDRALAELADDRTPRTVRVKLPWKKARSVKRPPPSRARSRAPDARDLEGLWASAQALHFAIQEAQAPQAGFPAFARTATCRKYRVHCQPLIAGETSTGPALGLYELTTGAAALTESLALHRLEAARARDRGTRSLLVSDIGGITIAEHPWKKMMGDRKPRDEPLARLVPHDNYYLTVYSLPAFVEALDLLGQWGGNLLRPMMLHDRDHRLRQRYETQLCLPTAELARALKPKLLLAAALTGNDLFWQEGSDITALFEVTDTRTFLAAHQVHIDRARKAFGSDFKETTTRLCGYQVQSFTTARREISLHRVTVLGWIVICSNSLIALARVLETQGGRLGCLADSLDFQYMRTVFVRQPGEEDGFAFLSDAFIRRLVGPATRIKARRRLEARAALTLASHGALLTAWETGRLPTDHAAMLRGSGLILDELTVPEGKPVVWDGKRRQAVSEVYNTLAFSTPLVELPIDKVTEREKWDYVYFRLEYLRQWRQFFDPVGLRFSLGKDHVRVETYILPLLESNGYSFLRGLAGSGLTRHDPARVPPGTLGQFLFHYTGVLKTPGIGDWLVIHLGDDPSAYRDLVRYRIGTEMGLPRRNAQEEYERLVWRLPVTFGVGMKDEKVFTQAISELWTRSALSGGKSKVSNYRGVPITRAPVRASGYRQLVSLLELMALNEDGTTLRTLLDFVPRKRGPEALYQAVIDGGYFFSWREEAIRSRIDAALARGKTKPGKGTPVNAALHLAPSGPLQLYLEWQTQRRALASNVAWEALYRAGVVTAKMSPAQRDSTAIRLLGFAPVSPDALGHAFDGRTGEVRNLRHGSFRRPVYHDRLAPASDLARLLEQIRTVGADLRFREDGIHTRLVIERQSAKK
jgi:hypothetical protein